VRAGASLTLRACLLRQVCTSKDTILSPATIKALVGAKCDGVIGQLTEKWDKDTFGALRAAGGTAYSNYAVGYDNVNVADATAAGVAVGNTPGARCGGVAPGSAHRVFAPHAAAAPDAAPPTRRRADRDHRGDCGGAHAVRRAPHRGGAAPPRPPDGATAAPAWLAASRAPLRARPRAQADVFMRAGQYKGWLPTLFVGQLLQGATVGIVGAGRIGAAYARMVRASAQHAPAPRGAAQQPGARGVMRAAARGASCGLRLWVVSCRC